MRNYEGMKWGQLTEQEKKELLKDVNLFAGSFGFEHHPEPGETCIVDLKDPYSVSGRLEVAGDNEMMIIIDDNAIIYNPTV